MRRQRADFVRSVDEGFERSNQELKMSIFKRMSQVFQQKANAALNKVENPTEALDLSYEKMLENLQQVRRSIADVLTSQKRLEAQRASLQSQYDKLQGQARQALQQGQEDVAKLALTRAQDAQKNIVALDPQINQLQSQEQALEETGRKLQSKIEVFRAQRDTMKAQYTAAKASTQAMESLGGLSEQMTDVNLMMDRAKDKVDEMQARAAAVSQLSDSGVLDSPALGGSGDDIEAALAASSMTNNVDLQLEQMKAELSEGTKGAPLDNSANQQLPNYDNGAKGSSQPPAAAPTAELNQTNSLTIRIAGEARYKVPVTIQPALEGLDTAMELAISQSDEVAFAKLTKQLTKLIRGSGTELSDADLTASDLVVPSADMSIADATKILGSEEPQDAEEDAQA